MCFESFADFSYFVDFANFANFGYFSDFVLKNSGGVTCCSRLMKIGLKEFGFVGPLIRLLE